MATKPGGQGEISAQRDPLTPDEVMFLARQHTRRSIERLAALQELGGRQAGVAVSAAKALYEMAYPENDRLRRAVEKEIQRLIDEARGRKSLPPSEPR